jgi:hypothetical protein
VDKAHFIETAPLYYAIAIVQYLLENDTIEAASTAVRERFNDTSHPDDEPSLPFRPFFDRAVRLLVAEGLLEVLDDPFGPQMLFRTDSFHDDLNRLAENRASPFHRFRRIKEPLPWLFSALASLEETRVELGVEAEDMAIDEWAPLELDRSESELIALIQSVDDTVEKVRGDNGYAASAPQERAFTLQSLVAFSTTLKEAAATSLPYIRHYAIEPLAVLGRRFARGALELTITTAKEALKAWLKKHGLDWLNELWN